MRAIQCVWQRGALLGLGALLLAACANAAPADAIVGSGNMQELTLGATSVRRVTIVLPFHAVVYNGEPRKLTVRGEDNLLEYIDVAEVSHGEWKISVPEPMTFRQHHDVELDIPYVGMVEFRVDADHVEFADDPASVWLGVDAQH